MSDTTESKDLLQNGDRGHGIDPDSFEKVMTELRHRKGGSSPGTSPTADDGAKARGLQTTESKDLLQNELQQESPTENATTRPTRSCTQGQLLATDTGSEETAMSRSLEDKEVDLKDVLEPSHLAIINAGPAGIDKFLTISTTRTRRARDTKTWAAVKQDTWVGRWAETSDADRYRHPRTLDTVYQLLEFYANLILFVFDLFLGQRLVNFLDQNVAKLLASSETEPPLPILVTIFLKIALFPLWATFYIFIGVLCLVHLLQTRLLARLEAKTRDAELRIAELQAELQEQEQRGPEPLGVSLDYLRSTGVRRQRRSFDLQAQNDGQEACAQEQFGPGDSRVVLTSTPIAPGGAKRTGILTTTKTTATTTPAMTEMTEKGNKIKITAGAEGRRVTIADNDQTDKKPTKGVGETGDEIEIMESFNSTASFSFHSDSTQSSEERKEVENGRKITPAKRRGKSGHPLSWWNVGKPHPTLPRPTTFHALPLASQLLCICRKVPLLGRVLRDPRDPPALAYLDTTPVFITDDGMRRLLELWATKPSDPRGTKRILDEVYDDEDYCSADDSDYVPDVLETTDPLEYTEADGAGVSDDEGDEKGGHAGDVSNGASGQDRTGQDRVNGAGHGDVLEKTNGLNSFSPASLQHMQSCSVPLEPMKVANGKPVKLDNGGTGLVLGKGQVEVHQPSEDAVMDNLD